MISQQINITLTYSQIQKLVNGTTVYEYENDEVILKVIPVSDTQ